MPARSSQLIRSFDLQGDPLISLAISKGSTLLAASNGQGKLQIWDMESGRQLHTIDAQRILEYLMRKFRLPIA